MDEKRIQYLMLLSCVIFTLCAQRQLGFDFGKRI